MLLFQTLRRFTVQRLFQKKIDKLHFLFYIESVFGTKNGVYAAPL